MTHPPPNIAASASLLVSFVLFFLCFPLFFCGFPDFARCTEVNVYPMNYVPRGARSFPHLYKEERFINMRQAMQVASHIAILLFRPSDRSCKTACWGSPKLQNRTQDKPCGYASGGGCFAKF